MAGFNSPSILFLQTWDTPERIYANGLLRKLRLAGYTRYEEPSVGGFAMPLVAKEAGWDTRSMGTSDTHLYTSVLGELIAGRGMDALDVRLHGDPVADPSHEPVRQAAEVIWEQYLARLAPQTKTYYWAALVESLQRNAEGYLSSLEEQLSVLAERLEGVSYRPRSLWDHLAAVADDPEAVVISNPPTYPGAYETFFDTDGAITWNQPDYDVFNAPEDIPRMVEFMQGKAALLIVQQQQVRGNSAHPQPIYARQLTAGDLVYINSNRPDEVGAVMDGAFRVSNVRKPAKVRRKWPMIPDDHVVRPDSAIDVFPVDTATAESYRRHWMHRISSAPGGNNLLVTVDGYAAGVIGYSLAPLVNSYENSPWKREVLLRFAFGAPHQTLRLTRLATMVALDKGTVWRTANSKTSLMVEASKGIITVEMTRQPEAKGLRGLMKLVDRQSHPDGYKLTYHTEWPEQRTLRQTLRTFLEGESRWQKTRASSKSA